jgi:hypothetical protein
MTVTRQLTAIVIAIACVSTRAEAQPPASPSAPSVFGGTGSGAASRESITLSISLAEAYDGNVVAEAGQQASVGMLQESGFYSALSAGLNVGVRRERIQFSAFGGTDWRYFSDLREVVDLDHRAGAGFTVRFGEDTTIRVDQTLGVRPAALYYLFAKAADTTIAPELPGSSYALGSEKQLLYGTVAGLTHRVGRRGTLSFNGGYRGTQTIGTSQSQFGVDFRAFDVGGSYAHGVTRDASLRFGYSYSRGEYGEAVQPEQHGIDIGINYAVPLSATRRTRMGFSMGSGIVNGPATGDGGLADDPTRLQYNVLAGASLVHQIGRTWNLQGTYNRGLGLLEGVPEPVFSDSVTVSGGGMLNRRSDLSLTAAYSIGQSAFVQRDADFATYTGSARTRIAITRMYAVSFEYLYYFYDFSAGARAFLGDLPRELSRHSVRAGLTFWIPIRQR